MIFTSENTSRFSIILYIGCRANLAVIQRLKVRSDHRGGDRRGERE